MIGYLDLPSGISGDMFLSALVDAGLSVEQLRGELNRLNLPPQQWALEAQSVMKGPLRATHVSVTVPHLHHHRRLKDVRQIIEQSQLPLTVKKRAVAVFVRLAEAEAKVHDTTPDKIHFHEVGAVDAIIDIVGSVYGLHALGVEKLYASALPMGEGWAKTEHGQIPLPAPATLELLAQVAAPTRPAPGPGEWVTPTGAALLAELATFRQPAMRISRIGVGAGTRNCAWPNVVRLWLGEEENGDQPLVELHTNIDDMNPQLYPAVSQQLLAGGALDVWLTPVQMKKGRPGVLLSVLCPAARESDLAQIILRQTTSLGVRVVPVSHRHVAQRQIRPVQTPLGEVAVKFKHLDQQLVGAAPEYDDCQRLADERGVSVRQVYEAALHAANAEVHSELPAKIPTETPATEPAAAEPKPPPAAP